MIRKAHEMKMETRDKMRGGNGTVAIRHCVAGEEFTAPVRLCARLTLPPGASIGTHRHDKEDEVYIITGGSGMLDDGRTETRVAAGDAVLTGNGESHAIRNDGNDDLEILAVIVRYPES
jgi:mannose-6-phosphate isomerase-like protein (cupin superfamily)